MRRGRFWFTPSWKLTYWGCLPGSSLRISRSCDEFHNPSRYLIVPLVGEFVLFDRDYDVDQPEHIWARINGSWEGADVAGCAICIEIKEEA